MYTSEAVRGTRSWEARANSVRALWCAGGSDRWTVTLPGTGFSASSSAKTSGTPDARSAELSVRCLWNKLPTWSRAHSGRGSSYHASWEVLCVTTLDELPQLINVLRGDMGPIRRREVRRDRMDASEWIAGETRRSSRSVGGSRGIWTASKICR